MSLVAAAVCPHPPLLVPAFAGAAAPELDELRAACRAAITVLLGGSPDLIVVVGCGPDEANHPTGAVGSFAPWGVRELVTLGAPSGVVDPTLPLSLSVGAWLLGSPPCPVIGRSLPAGTPPERCAAVGASIAASAASVGLLVMGDGSTCRTEKAPGYLDPRAAPFDAAVSAALSRGNVAELAAIDPVLADELHCSGRAPWQVLAGAAGDAAPPRRTVHYDDAPYGVAYLVASWG
ncbi:hypothetical protein Val02_28240 [Virgisporangium aliadipatigenens]|uniref:Extradiol ring-cleavage dioxygenase class III enzyme subunit B domain-containing protein n=1 Tax=Virgisporangium aliadipatigenens TaxID=741659 RepID=A0A8J3YLG0_9ACTN|nr:class III extradiol dioxygenase subunit B-like domain-containing protein [Virgisporangium aliadipatigenens]GIJ45938.1 hypothetical protein Val02_28240 [Virgisporangium aliadipatigenens]